MSSEKQSFLDEGAMGLQSSLWVFDGQITRLYDATILGGVRCTCDELEKLHFSAHLRCLKGYSAFSDFIKNQSIGVV